MIAQMRMRELRQWLCWRYEQRNGKDTKVPYSPRTGGRASSTDPATWTTLEEAKRACEEHDYAGIGFVFTAEDPFCGIDLDNCRDPETGELEEWAREIISELNSYSEVSPSGRGVHVLCRGELPSGRNRKGRVEMYARGRFFTVTGEHVLEMPLKIEERTEALEALASRVFGQPERNGRLVSAKSARIRGALDDEELLKKASEAVDDGKFAELFEGGYCGLPSHSEAVASLLFKLAFWTRRDAEQMDRLFRRSDLFYDKWDERRGNTTWGAKEIERAIESVSEVYTPQDVGKTALGTNGTAAVVLKEQEQPWPELAPEAYYGLPGDIVSAIEPHTEADPVAILANLLCAFGNSIGRGAFMKVGADAHHLKLNAALVGESAKGRKGMSWGHVRDLMHAADDFWVEDRVLSGLSSGEGLIHAVRDRVESENKEGETVVQDPGVEDKRLLVLEAELASVLKVMNREGNTLSPLLRQAWDGGALQTLTKNSPAKATGSHISIIGHITKEELLRHLTETEAANGFANRFLWILVKRSKMLPFGGEWFRVDTVPLVEKLESALRFGANPVQLDWGESAREMWRAVYGTLSEGKGGMFGAVAGRSEAQTLRLAALYAVTDESATIEEGHLIAALALWQYAEESVRYIFGDATGDPVADQIVQALREAGDNGMSRTEIRDLFNRHRSADHINGALAMLARIGRVSREREETGGRPTERWFLK